MCPRAGACACCPSLAEFLPSCRCLDKAPTVSAPPKSLPPVFPHAPGVPSRLLDWAGSPQAAFLLLAFEILLLLMGMRRGLNLSVRLAVWLPFLGWECCNAARACHFVQLAWPRGLLANEVQRRAGKKRTARAPEGLWGRFRMRGLAHVCARGCLVEIGRWRKSGFICLGAFGGRGAKRKREGIKVLVN